MLVASTSVASAQSTKSHRFQLEKAACKLLSFTPEPTSVGQEAIAVPEAMLSALERTGDKSLENVVRAYERSALADNMISALNSGVKVCHGLGVRTGM
jgi:hypothetical protein